MPVVRGGFFLRAESSFLGLLPTHLGVLRSPEDDVPPTGMRLHIRFAVATQVSDGKITSHKLWYDRAEIMAQLGLLPAVARS